VSHSGRSASLVEERRDERGVIFVALCNTLPRMKDLILTQHESGVVVARSPNDLDTTAIYRISRPYWHKTPSVAGVYILFGESDGQPTVYVGMSQTDMRRRIGQHHVTPAKDWFGTLFAIPMSVSQVQAVEADLLNQFQAAGFARVVNALPEDRWVAVGDRAAEALVATLIPWLEILLGTEVVIGVEERVAPAAGEARSGSWTEQRWLDAIQQNHPGSGPAMSALLACWHAAGRRVEFGAGKTQAGAFACIDAQGTSYWLLSVYSKTAVEINFQWLARRPITDEIEVRREIAARLNRIPGVVVAEDQLERRPSFPLAILINEETRAQMLEVEAWLAELVTRDEAEAH
jgi:hypothetical protein